MERTNFRYMKPDDLPGRSPDFAAIDVSFISLKLILPPLKAMLTQPARIVALIKPQFEAGREKVGKNGIVRDPAVHREVLETCSQLRDELGFALERLDLLADYGRRGQYRISRLLALQGKSRCRIAPVNCRNMRRRSTSMAKHAREIHFSLNHIRGRLQAES